MVLSDPTLRIGGSPGQNITGSHDFVIESEPKVLTPFPFTPISVGICYNPVQ